MHSIYSLKICTDSQEKSGRAQGQENALYLFSQQLCSPRGKASKSPGGKDLSNELIINPRDIEFN